ncbi:hypothetical protein O181_096753 [Austropuccinia psidii MF-1]|uniref:Uncharacterized protein n=1 Tax=Austropuccinia psidii MF-1 TaxID=1389203 RepID=A0A9Q3J7K1_9BASI|nr:hypothetical protein [Austropuccinia psidii MF-1]
MRDSSVGPFTIIKFIGKNSEEVKLTEERSRKHSVFPVSIVKPYFQTEEDKFPSRKKSPNPPEIVDVEDSPGPVKKIINARNIRLNGKDQRQYLTPPEIVEVEDSPQPVKKIINARKIILNGKDQRQYLVRFKNRQQIKTNSWLKMPYQMGTFI